MAKAVSAMVKLQIPAGNANPAPPVGPALGHRHFKFFNKQAFAPHLGQCAIQNLIAAGRHSNNFDIALRI